jgi:uncharacterized iron-regulated membrane protein
MNLRISDKTVFAWHSWLGLIVGVFTLFLSITGTMLLFSDEIDVATASHLTTVKPTTKRYPLDSMLATLRRSYPAATPRGTFLYNGLSNRAIMTEVMLDNERQWVYWNPYTNQLNGSRKRNDVPMVQVLALHEELASDGWAHFVLFWVGLALIGSVISGLWYYRKFLFNVYKVGIRRKNSYLFNADLHKWVGVTSCLFLLVMGGTGTFFHWEKIERMLGETKKNDISAQTKSPAAPILSSISYSLDSLTKQSTTLIKGFTPQYIGYQSNSDGEIIISGTRLGSNRLLGRFNTSLMFNPRSGQLPKIMHKEDGDLETKIEKSFEQIHYGQYGGIWSKILYALGGLCLAIASLTGFMIWWKKR